MNNQPRRYRIRDLHDSDGLTQGEIAEELGISQATVQRDLSQTVAPAGRTPGGAVFYPAGRFDEDPEFRQRVAQLETSMPMVVAKREAAREFAGTGRLQAGRRIRTEDAKQGLLGQVDRALDEATRA